MTSSDATVEVHVQPTEYTVNLLPEDGIDGHLFGITVQYRGGGRWAVVHLSSCLGADGSWDFGVKEYDRGDDWLNAHRFDEQTALRLAKEAAPGVTVNGITAAEALRRRAAAGASS